MEYVLLFLGFALFIVWLDWFFSDERAERGRARRRNQAHPSKRWARR